MLVVYLGFTHDNKKRQGRLYDATVT